MKPSVKKLESVNVKFETKLEFDRLLTELMAEWGRKPSQDEVTREVLRVYRESKTNPSAIQPETKVTISPLTEKEKSDKNCVTPQELDLRRALSFIMNSGNERIIAHVSGVLAVSEDFVRLGVANDPADAEPPPGGSQAPSNPKLPKKSGRNVQDIGRGDKRLRGERRG